MKRLPLGCVMVDVEGFELDSAERGRLEHPVCGGVILFARNYRDPDQLRELCRQIKEIRNPPLLIAVDHEGGRVQRFRDGFTRLPPMRSVGMLWDKDRLQALRVARDIGMVIGKELGDCGIDFSFAPVLDIDHGHSTVIGDRAFHSTAAAVTELAGALIEGLGVWGMSAVGKHFPGHGGVAADTHHAVAVDHRQLEVIERDDLQPFKVLCSGALGGVMPAHVIYDQVDRNPAGFSRFWLQRVLRERLGFEGVIFSDDLSMHGASGVGDPPARADAALAAGCDVVLVCNAPEDAQAVLHGLASAENALREQRLLALHRHDVGTQRQVARAEEDYEQALAHLATVMALNTAHSA